MKNFWVYSFSLSFNSDLLHVKKKKKQNANLLEQIFSYFHIIFQRLIWRKRHQLVWSIWLSVLKIGRLITAAESIKLNDLQGPVYVICSQQSFYIHLLRFAYTCRISHNYRNAGRCRREKDIVLSSAVLTPSLLEKTRNSSSLSRGITCPQGWPWKLLYAAIKR